MNDAPRIECRDICKMFPAESGPPAAALDHISFDVMPGEIMGVLGPDGAGKSTLLRLTTGLMKATSGSMTVQGFDASRQSAKIQERIGYMPQKFALYEDLTIEENLNLYASLHNVPAKQRPGRFRELLEMTDLARFTNRFAGKLSGGMKQKLGLICTLISSPSLIILDEPTVGVDPLSRRELWRILQKVAKEEGVSVLVSTSYLDEAKYCQKAIILYQGKMLVNAAPDEISNKAGGMSFDITPPEHLRARHIQNFLSSLPSTINSSIHGREVRVVIPPSSPDFAKLAQWNPREAAPDFMDGFMTVLGAHERDPEIVSGDSSTHVEQSDGSSTMIEVKNMTRKFGSFVAVDNVSFSVRKGEIFGLLGPNGAGKSTTFRMLCGLLPATQGELNVAGFNLRVAAPKARTKIGYMAQKFSQYGNLTVRQNMEFSAGAYGMRGEEKEERIEIILKEFQLEENANHIAGTLPGGYKQRLGMACALLHSPEILFLDEPTSGADPFARRAFWQRIGALADNGVTVVVTTHFLDEAEYCDNIVIMMDGINLAQGSPAEIRSYALSKNGKTPSLEDAFIAITEKNLKSPHLTAS